MARNPAWTSKNQVCDLVHIGGRIPRRYVTKFALQKTLKSFAAGKLTFDERVAFQRVSGLVVGDSCQSKNNYFAET